MEKLLDYIHDKDHVIWDWNGTLLNDVAHAVATMNQFLAPRGLPPMDVERYRRTFGFPIRKYYESLGFDLVSVALASLCDQYVEAFMRKVFECALVPGSREFLRAVRDAGKTQSVLSATHQPQLHRMVTAFELEPCFDFVYGIEDKLAFSKVHRGHDLLRASGIPASRTVLIGDTDHDLEVGEALGIDVVLVTHGHQCAERLRGLHRHVVDL